MPKKKSISFWKIYVQVCIEFAWYLLITVIPAVLAIYQFFFGERLIALDVFYIWLGLFLFYAIGIFFISIQKYKQEISPKKRKRKNLPVLSTGPDFLNGDSVTISIGGKAQNVINGNNNTVTSNAATAKDNSISVSGNNYAPIINAIEPRQQKRPNLTSLIEIREKGYLLRNKGIHLQDEFVVDFWIEEFEIWNIEMLNALSTIDKDKAKLLKVLGNLPRNTMTYAVVYSSNQLLKLDTFTEKLRRLDQIIEDYLKLPQ